MVSSFGICQLCGEERELTREHLPQKALYPKSIRSKIGNMNVVRACMECNNSQKIADELFKVFVGIVAGSPWRNEIVEGVESTITKNQRIERMLEVGTRVEKVESPTGPRDAHIFKLPKENTPQLLSVVERIVKGLYFQEFGEVLVKNHKIGVFHPEGIDSELKINLEKALKLANWKTINANTVKYCFTPVENGAPVCVINLFESVIFYLAIVKKQPIASNKGQYA